ncbi:MAG: transporter substrate-binding domain-containing protein [Oscillospiraceae bacterium]|jgi:putative lysine transport system substrate-binding protein|nr:transporter substrate-binding domain-containing protein [Oscillospiraceae bacterium]
MKKFTALLLALTLLAGLAACGGAPSGDPTPAASPAGSAEPAETPGAAVASGVEDGVLTVAMECAYAPYNWAQADDSNGAVPIKDSSEYANGYDVMMAKKLCEANGWALEIVRLDWDSLIPAVQTGLVDAVIAGQSMTPERMEQVDFAGPYLYATIVCLTLKDGAFASAKGISDLAGGTATSQLGTIWYDTCLPQVKDAKIQPAAETAPAMLMALATKTVDFVCTDMPTAQGAVAVYPEMTILDFSGGGDDFAVSESDVNIGISLMKGNAILLDALNNVLSAMTADDFNVLMAEATEIQPSNG